MHVNGAMGVVCAAPTGGSAGVLPGMLVTLAEERSLSREEIGLAMLAAGAIGVIVAQRATFAAEVARGLPCAVTLACTEQSVGLPLLNTLGGRRFRPYLSDDVTGVEVGGAVKNVIAIACGIVIGRGLGENARAALITRGLAEVVRLNRAKGGRAETSMGLSGLGDLTLTCCGPQSRNYSLGVALGEGRALTDVLGERHTVAEGVFTAEAVSALAARLGVDMPICEAVHAVLHLGADLGVTIAGLLARPFRSEHA